MLKKLYDLDCINLEKLLLLNFAKLNLTEKEFIILLFLLKNSKNSTTLDLENLKNISSFPLQELSVILDALIKKEYISLEICIIKNKEREIINIDETFKKLEKILESEKLEIKVQKNKADLAEIIELLEKEFGRTLSPLELEIVREWFSQKIKKEDLTAAIKEAVKNNRCTLKYIDAILVNQIKNKSENVIKYEKDEHFEQQLYDLFSTFKR